MVEIVDKVDAHIRMLSQSSNVAEKKEQEKYLEFEMKFELNV
jgi:hypothetical protein